MVNRSSIIAAALAASLAARPVFAQPAPSTDPKADAAALFNAGRASYTRGDYPTAATNFHAAYQLDPDPVYLFNEAQADRLGKRCAEAATAYRAYLAAAPDATNRDKVEGWVVAMDACAGGATTEPTTAPSTDAGAAHPPDVTPAPVRPAAPHHARAGRGKTIAGLVVGGVGVLAIGAGVYFTTRIGPIEDKLAGQCPAAPCTWGVDNQTKRDDLIDDGDAAQRNAWIGYTVGGAALITGTVLYVLGQRDGRAPALEVTPTGDGAAVSLRRSF